MPRKKEMPKIHSASVSYNGNANKFDSFLAAMINDCLESDWIPLYVECGDMDWWSEDIIENCESNNKNSVA